MSEQQGLRPLVKALFLALLIALAVDTTGALAQQPPDYRLRPGDEIEISVWKEVDLQRKLAVRPDGKVSFPLVGEVTAGGRTVVDVQGDITSRLVKYIPEPVVTVSVVGINGNKAYVIGQVTRPGAIDMNPQVNVLQALSLVGGTTPYASTNDIIVIRNAGGRQQVMPFRYADVSRGRSLEQNVVLEAGDVVVVP